MKNSALPHLYVGIGILHSFFIISSMTSDVPVYSRKPNNCVPFAPTTDLTPVLQISSHPDNHVVYETISACTPPTKHSCAVASSCSPQAPSSS